MSVYNSSENENKIFMKVLGVKVDDIQNWTRPTSQNHQRYEVAKKEKLLSVPSSVKPGMSSERMVGQRRQKGYLVCVNDELIALFRVQGKLYAVKDSCPHAGGPLSMGDIEELPGEGLCVRCPWHQWAILLDTGCIGERKGRPQCAVIYPVRVTGDGDIYIGFDQVSQSFFDIDKHPDVELAS